MFEFLKRITGGSNAEKSRVLSKRELQEEFKRRHVSGVYADSAIRANVQEQTVTVHHATGHVITKRFSGGNWELAEEKREGPIWGLGGYK